jgi:hypothetical protein
LQNGTELEVTLVEKKECSAFHQEVVDKQSVRHLQPKIAAAEVFWHSQSFLPFVIAGFFAAIRILS